MFCKRCGVEVESGRERCPLCGDTDLTEDAGFVESIPEYEPLRIPVEQARIGRVYRRLVALCAVTAIAIVVIVDALSGGPGLQWSAIAAVAIASGTLFAVVPSLSLGLRTVAIIDLLGAGLLLFVIDAIDGNGVEWFVGIALPILAVLAVLFFVSVVAITRVRGVAKAAVVLGACTALCIAIDLSIVRFYSGTLAMSWSWIVLVSVAPIALFLLLLQVTVLRYVDFRRRLHL
jgi:hypothetical protein